jgi:dUTP pyrophosphatase
MIFTPTQFDGLMVMQEDSCTELTPQTSGSAGIDLPAAESAQVAFGEVVIVSTKCRTIMPRGFCAMVCSRSGLAAKHGVMVVNAPGIIDSDYRDEVKVILTKIKNDGVPFAIEAGDRIAQLVFMPVATSSTIASGERNGGLGSTGTH